MNGIKQQANRMRKEYKDKRIATFIDELQRGKVGIYPYHVTVAVSTEFGLTYKEAAEHVLKHIRKEMTIYEVA